MSKRLFIALITLILCASFIGSTLGGQPVSDSGPRYFGEVSEIPPTIDNAGVLYTKTDGYLYYKDAAGVEVQLGATASTPGLATVLAVSNTSGAYDLTMDYGQKITTNRIYATNSYDLIIDIADRGAVTINGPDISTDGGMEVWTDANNLTSWTTTPSGETSTLDREGTIKQAGNYSAKFTAVGGNPVYINQLISGLTYTDTYEIGGYVYSSDAEAKANLILINDTFASATQIYNFTTDAWETYSGGAVTDGQMHGFTVAEADAWYRSEYDVSVPASGKLNVYFAGDATRTLYLDTVTVELKSDPNGMDVEIYGGTGSTSNGSGGDVSLISGNAAGTGSDDGGDVEFILGRPTTGDYGTGDYGQVQIITIDGADPFMVLMTDTTNAQILVDRTLEIGFLDRVTDANEAGKNIEISAQDGGEITGGIGGAGGDVTLAGGDAVGTGDNDGGDVNITLGTSTGSGSDGTFNIGTSYTVDGDGSIYNGGGLARHRTPVSDEAYTVEENDYRICYTVLTEDRTVTLPDSLLVTGITDVTREFVIKDEGGDASTHNIVVDPEGSTQIDGEDTYKITIDYGSITIYSTGTGWGIN